MFNFKKNHVSAEYDAMSSPAILPVQNVYSPYFKASNPSMIRTKEEMRKHRYEKPEYADNRVMPRDRYTHERGAVFKEAEEMAQKNRTHTICSRLFCCFCFPCLPMWTRTICCVLFLFVVAFVSLVLGFLLSFEKPEIVFNGGNHHMSPQTNQTIMEFQYSIYNGNFFELYFDNIRVMMYYPTPNKTTVGFGEISKLQLGPQAVTNVSFPIGIVGDNEMAFENMFIELCKEKNNDKSSNTDESKKNKQRQSVSQKDILVNVDIMPTIRFLNNHVVTIALKGQNTKIPCSKVLY